MKTYLTLLFVLLPKLFSQQIIDASSTEKPNWITSPPKGIHFKYYTGVAVSKESLEKAKLASIANALKELSYENKLSVSSTSTISSTVKETESAITKESSIVDEIRLTGSSTTITGLSKEEEYWQTFETRNGLEYQYWILLKIPNTSEKVNYSELNQNRKNSATWRSVIIPGWGQYHKNERTKSYIIFGSSALFLSSAIYSSSKSIEFNDEAKRSINQFDRDWYTDRSNRYHNIKVISWILFAGVYGYNIFDVLSSDGEKQYAQLPIEPIFTDGSMSLTFTISL